MRSRVAAVVALLVLGALVPLPAGPAAAHARLIASDPAANAVLDTAPERIVLTFSEPVEAEFGQLQVSGPTGERLDSTPPTSDDVVTEAPISPATTPGTYTVAYRVISADGHPVEGSFVYELSEAVAGAAEEPTDRPTGEPTSHSTPSPISEPTATATPTPEATVNPTPTPTPAELDAEETAAVGDSDEGGFPLLPVAVVALLLLGVGGALLARRRDADDAAGPTPPPTA